MENESSPPKDPPLECATSPASHSTIPDLTAQAQPDPGSGPPLRLEGRLGKLKREAQRIEVRPSEFLEATHITLPDRPKSAIGKTDSWLAKHLTQHGMSVFEQLCSLGCDREILGGLFTLLVAQPIRIIRKPRVPKENEVGHTKELDKARAASTKSGGECYLASLHPLDLLETALRNSGKITIRELQRTAQRAKKLREEIISLKRTPIVRWLQQRGYIRPPDLLSGLPSRGSTEPYFRGLLSLPHLAKQAGARKKPDFERQLKKIYQHIYERTSDWHDDFVAEILSDLRRPELGHVPTNADALQKWRARHHLTASRRKQ